MVFCISKWQALLDDDSYIIDIRVFSNKDMKITQTALHEESIISITEYEHIRISAEYAEMPVYRCMEIITSGLCVRVASTMPC
jgi:hypothetical protein